MSAEKDCSLSVQQGDRTWTTTASHSPTYRVHVQQQQSPATLPASVEGSSRSSKDYTITPLHLLHQSSAVWLVQWNQANQTELRVMKEVSLVDARMGREKAFLDREDQHPNIIKYLGMHRSPFPERRQSHCIFDMELMDLASLDQVLQQLTPSRPTEPTSPLLPVTIAPPPLASSSNNQQPIIRTSWRLDPQLNDTERLLLCETIGFQVLMALAYIANFHGISHCDIKPQNILINSDGRVKLRGFDRGAESVSGIGTVAYLAPEVMLAERYDNKCDMWSFGVVMFELASGQHPLANEIKLLYCDDFHLFKNVESRHGKGNIQGAIHDWDLVGPAAATLTEPTPSVAVTTAPEAAGGSSNEPPQALSTRRALRDLLARCLVQDASQRITASEALDHEFFAPYRMAPFVDPEADVATAVSFGIPLSSFMAATCRQWKAALTAEKEHQNGLDALTTAVEHSSPATTTAAAAAPAPPSRRRAAAETKRKIGMAMKRLLYKREEAAVKTLKDWLSWRREHRDGLQLKLLGES